MRSSLFRKEAVIHKTNRFASRATLVSPLSFAVLSLFVLFVAVAVVVFVFLGKYSPKDTVRGYVATMGGVEIYAQSDGTILTLRVAEGDKVVKNQELLTLGTSRAVSHSAETSESVVEALRSEQKDLQMQAEREDEAFDVQEQGIKDEIKSLRARIRLLSEQREDLLSGLTLTKRASDRLTSLGAPVYVSSKDRDDATAAIVEYEIRLKSLDLVIDSSRSDIRHNEQRLAEIPVVREARAAEMRVMKHELSIRVTENIGRSTQRVLAPTGGVVSGLLVRDGQTIASSNPLLNIIPEHSDYYVEVLVPTRTIAFIRPGARVKIRYDAYPHQKFGIQEGVVESVSRTTVLPNDKRFRISITEPVYLAHVRIPHQSVEAYGEWQPLQSGMTLTADVLRDQRRVVEWIFDPLISAAKKL